MADTLAMLLGSPTRVKVLKLFVFNTGTPFGFEEIKDRTRENSSKIRTELNLAEKIGLVKRKSFARHVEKRVRKRKVIKRIKVKGWILNDNFAELIPLQTFLVTAGRLGPKEVIRKLAKAGSLKLIAIAGVFIQEPESRVDLLVVGDHLKRSVLETAIKSIESEMGKEIRYSIFDTQDFLYRQGIYDKLIREILDFPHEKVLNKLDI